MVSKKRAVKFFIAAIAVIVLALLFLYWWHVRDGRSANAFQTAVIGYGDISKIISTSGTVDPVVLVNVGTQVSGTVNKLYANFNDHVRVGEVLLTLDPTLFKAQVAVDNADLKSDEANLLLAQKTAARILQLYKQDYETQQDLDQAVEAQDAAEDAVKAVQAQLLHDETTLSYTVIRSPVNGTVIDREVELGQTVAASLQTPTLFLLGANLADMQIDTYVSEADVGRVRPGQPAKFTVYAYPGHTFAGEVVQVRQAPITVQNVVTYDVIVSAPNPTGLLLPGMTADVTITTASTRHVLRLPRTALAFTPPAAALYSAAVLPAGHKRVWVLRQVGLVPVPVSLGVTNDQYAEITGGALSAGERVAVGMKFSVEASPSSERHP